MMIDVQIMGKGAYLVRLDDRLLEEVWFGSPDAIVHYALETLFSAMFPHLFRSDDEVPF